VHKANHQLTKFIYFLSFHDLSPGLQLE